MSSLEVLKHARNVFSIIKGKTLKSKHKAVEILIEVAIIVFAISLSLYLERWREEKNDHKTETRFLEGLKSDLGTDLRELRLSAAKCVSMKAAAAYFLGPEGKNGRPTASIIMLIGYFITFTFFPIITGMNH